MAAEEIKTEESSVRKTCPRCHSRIRVKPSRTTCQNCGGVYGISYQGKTEGKKLKPKEMKSPAPKKSKKFSVYVIECSTKNHFYVGQTSSYEHRIKQHKDGKGMAFTKKYGVRKVEKIGSFSSRDEAMEKEKSLRRELFEKGYCVNRCYGKCKQVNEIEPSKPSHGEAQRGETEVNKQRAKEIPPNISGEHFFIQTKRGAKATALITNNGIQVLKESSTAQNWVTSTPEAVMKKGDELRKEGIIINNLFTQDYIFKSPSMAAAVVQGRSANGLRDWKNKDGKSLKEVMRVT